MSEITSLCEPTSSEADGVLGGRCVDTGGINAGMLRCPRCFSRLLSQCGRLVERSGDEALLHVPRSSNASAEAADGAADSGTVTTAAADTAADPAADTAPDGACGWDAVPHVWWWVVEDVNDVDNVALSYLVTPPAAGAIRLALCSECRCGPLGYQRDGEAKVWFAAPLLRQQDAKYADDAADFPLPAGLDVAQLQAMLDSGQATVAFKTTFEEARLGMMLQDAADGDGVEVTAFTEFEGRPGPVELSGKVKLGDKVARVNGQSTRGLDFAAVLEMIIDAPRPLTLHWERTGSRPQEASRVAHSDFKPIAGGRVQCATTAQDGTR
mmetsp:Transcript_1929/g.5836  ORF Transcript_1929/g.5836 Transcript_1929/m.5836 type:complete len:325 (-) Transcript_1929:280-1254(-)